MDLGIEDRVALVTGSSRGIGRACAEALAEAGCPVAINARGEAELEAAARDIAADTGAKVVPVAADVADGAAVERLVAEARDALGPPDILVANAGGPPPGGFEDVGDDAWAAGFELTLMSAVRLTRHVLPHMKAQRWGRIVYVTSWSVLEPVESLILSNSLRRAVVGMAKTLAREVGPHGITVNAVAPGATATERLRDLNEDRARRRGATLAEVERDLTDAIPARRFAAPREVADAVAYLASERAAYVTGQTLPVEGGMVRRY